MKSLKTVILLTCFAVGSTAVAKSRTLIMQDKKDKSKFSGDLAKSWKKISDGKYSFDLDANQEVAPGTKVNVGMVKSAVEKRLKRKYKASVSIVDNDTVEISYQGEEEKFLRKIAKTKIKPVGDVKIAAASTVSDGGIRAKVAARAPKKGEIKVKIIKIKEGMADVFIIDAAKQGLPKDVKKNHTYKFKVTGESIKQGDVWIFNVGKKVGDSRLATAVK